MRRNPLDNDSCFHHKRISESVRLQDSSHYLLLLFIVIFTAIVNKAV